MNRLLLLLSISMFGCDSNQTGRYTGTVTKIHDGDTLWLVETTNVKHIVRFAYTDAPEVQQAHGIESRDILRSILLNRTAHAKCHKTDRYQRKVCTVYEDGTDINLLMVKSGSAWHYNYQGEQGMREARKYAKAEDQARNNGFGLWNGNPQPPWEYRKTR